MDKGIVHPKQYDFYMCAHAGPIVSLPVYQPNILEIASFQAVCDSTVDCVVICQALFGILNTVELVAGYAYYHQLPNCVSDFSCAVYIWHPKYCEMFAPS